jgi:hypothetical protein
MNLKSYSGWLKTEGYQPSTAQVTLRHIRVVAAAFNAGESIPEHCEPHVRRYLRFVAKTRKNPAGRAFVKQMLKDGFEPVADIQKHGARDRANLRPGDWDLLRAKLRRGDDISRMLVAYMQSTYRIGEFLNLRANEAVAIDDRIARSWIQARGSKKIYKILCATERCAYYRMRRRLQILCKTLRLDADLDTLYKSFKAATEADEARAAKEAA